MINQLFSNILKTGLQKNLVPAKSHAARAWFRNRASAIKKVNVPQIVVGGEQDAARVRNNITVGQMYMFLYDAKTKDDLPYYDRFPLIFPFRSVSGGFYGINMHYLTPFLRAYLMDALYDIARDDKYDSKTKLAITYKVLNASTKFKWFKPCVKRYLSSHVQSRFILVNANEWDIALFLPTERFVGARKARVWRDSERMINGR